MSEQEQAEAALGGSVTFVGAGPGDLSLMALAGAQAIERADVVVVEPGVTAEKLHAIGIDVHAEVIEVAEDQTAQLLAEVGRGRRVVRLAGSSCSAEAFHQSAVLPVLEHYRVEAQIIPAVSRAGHALVYSGVSPTPSVVNLDASQGITDDQPWPVAGTLVVWTDAQHLAAVAERGAREIGNRAELLLLTGLGTHSQRTTLTTWEQVATADVTGECYLICGPGIDPTVRSGLEWFASKPLFDWDVLVPRTKDSVNELQGELERLGANVTVVPTMSIEPPRTEQPMERAMRGIIDGHFGWLVFTSPVSVDAVMERLRELGLDSRALAGVRLASVGTGTLEALARYGLTPDFTPSPDVRAAGFASEFPACDELLDPINRVLVPSADVAVSELLAGLKRLGWEPEEVTAYRAVRAAPPPAEIRERIKTGMFDAVVFCSSTGVRNLVGIAGKPHNVSVITAVGPATAETCQQHGLRVDAVAPAPTPAALAGSLAHYAQQRRQNRLQQGLPIAKPSQRRRRRRRRAS